MLRLLIFTLAMSSAHAVPVIGIQDGDTLTVLHERRPIRIRLAFVDSPEKLQSFGQQAKQSLSDLCYRKNALLKIISIDKYGRAVALVSCAGVDVNRVQVERGLAWVRTNYNQDPSLLALQAAAAAKRRGLWVESHPVPPWTFRRADR